MVYQIRPFLLLLCIVCLLRASAAGAQTVPVGFTQALVAQGLASPTAMQFAPDGRLFVCEQTGAVRVIKNGVLLPAPFLTVPVDTTGERGLVGITFDPNFLSNGYVYVYYTATTPNVHNRLSRFTASGDVAMPGSEEVLIEFDEVLEEAIHNAGALDFGPDGKLYVAVGDHSSFQFSQLLENPYGKILRVNAADGSAPADNPFFNEPGADKRIWVWGLRNPFTFDINANGSKLFINDVGFRFIEEINDAQPGDNFGWSDTEGAFPPAQYPDFKNPLYWYDHTGACAITGGTFYEPPTAQFPADHQGDYFFADYCGDWIRKMEASGPGGGTPPIFASGFVSPVGLRVGSDGSLYVLTRGDTPTDGKVHRITFGTPPPAPAITAHPVNITVAAGQPATFSVTATGNAPLEYRWQRNGTDIPGQTGNGSPTYTLASTTLQDSGATFRVRVTNTVNNVISNSATLTVTQPNDAPVATITQPAANATYSGGTVIAFAGTATDVQDGALPASAFTWWIDFHHDTHTHPFLQPTSGAMNGSVTIPRVGEVSANVWYRIYLSVRDAGGLTHTVHRDVLPNKVRLTVNTQPAGLSVRLDGQLSATPVSSDSVVGVMRSLEAPSPLVDGNTTYEFVSWSDGGYATHDISTPGADTTYTATYRIVSATGPPPTPELYMFANGLTLHLFWARLPGATSYVLEGGSAPSATDLLNTNIGNVTEIVAVLPAGKYYGRLRAVGPGGTSGPSNEIPVELSGSSVCVVPPPAPTEYMAQVSGVTADLSWARSPGATSYTLEAGTAHGMANLLNANLGNVLSLRASAASGLYYTRLRALNACGISDPSPELPITLGCSAAPPVSGLTFTNINGVVTLAWTAAPTAAIYQVQVGTAPGLANVFNGPVGNTTRLSVNVAGLPPATYYVRVLGGNACGASTPSNEVTVSVP